MLTASLRVQNGRLPPTAAEDLLETFTRRYEVGATVVSNRPIEDGDRYSATLRPSAPCSTTPSITPSVQLHGKSYRMHDRRQHGDLTEDPS